MQPAQYSAPGVDEVETTAAQLEWQVLDVGVHVRDVRRVLAGEVEGLGGDVDGADEGA